jgi:hypothetical protein
MDSGTKSSRDDLRYVGSLKLVGKLFPSIGKIEQLLLQVRIDGLFCYMPKLDDVSTPLFRLGHFAFLRLTNFVFGAHLSPHPRYRR